MKLKKNTLPHLIGLFTTLYLLTSLFIYHTFKLPGGGSLPKKYFLNPANTIQLLSYKRNSPVICHPHQNAIIIPLSYSETKLLSSYKINCDKDGCVYNSNSQNPIRLISHNDPESILSEISDIIVDNKNQIISYRADSSEENLRVVLNFDGKLLHWINQSPSQNQNLSLKYYNPENQMFVYQDLNNNQYHYQAKGIALFRNPCK